MIILNQNEDIWLTYKKDTILELIQRLRIRKPIVVAREMASAIIE